LGWGNNGAGWYGCHGHTSLRPKFTWFADQNTLAAQDAAVQIKTGRRIISWIKIIMGEGKKQGERTEVGMTKLARHSWDVTPELCCENRVQGFQNSRV
jgi:hypothetical protein